ncbi:MAG: lytic transglycosylase domain-containing protein [Desulfuromonadaceae bacterium]|jgi:soluble lytic murein transglycosylase-like protein
MPSNLTWNLTGLLLVIFLAIPPEGCADIYRYVDAHGVVHFTDTPTSGAYHFYMKEKRSKDAKGSVVDLIEHYAKVFNLDDALIRAVIKVESDYNPHALSSKGAQGLMQLIPETARDMNVSDPYNPAQNIRGGSRYLRQMLDQFGDDLELALAAYNAGPSAVKRYGGIPPFAETQHYVEKVKKFYRHYQQQEETTL